MLRAAQLHAGPWMRLIAPRCAAVSLLAIAACRGSPPGPPAGSPEALRALVGLDTVVRARVAALDPGCAANLARAGSTGRCTDVGAAIAFAALRTNLDELAHVCRLAETLCGKGSP